MTQVRESIKSVTFKALFCEETLNVMVEFCQDVNRKA